MPGCFNYDAMMANSDVASGIEPACRPGDDLPPDTPLAWTQDIPAVSGTYWWKRSRTAVPQSADVFISPISPKIVVRINGQVYPASQLPAGCWFSNKPIPLPIHQDDPAG